jgi:hypothetical protein
MTISVCIGNHQGHGMPCPYGAGRTAVRPYENKTQLLDRMAISIVIGNQEGHGMPCPYEPPIGT